MAFITSCYIIINLLLYFLSPLWECNFHNAHMLEDFGAGIWICWEIEGHVFPLPDEWAGRRTSCVLFLESSREGSRHIQKDGGSSSPPKALKSPKILYDTSSFRGGGLSPGSRSLLRGMRTGPLERRNLGKCLSTVGDLWMGKGRRQQDFLLTWVGGSSCVKTRTADVGHCFASCCKDLHTLLWMDVNNNV